MSDIEQYILTDIDFEKNELLTSFEFGVKDEITVLSSFILKDGTLKKLSKKELDKLASLNGIEGEKNDIEEEKEEGSEDEKDSKKGLVLKHSVFHNGKHYDEGTKITGKKFDKSDIEILKKYC